MTTATPESLRRWTEQHALIMLLGAGGAWLEHSALLLAAMAAASWLGLLVRGRGHYAPGGGFGLANTLTAGRALGATALLVIPLHPTWQAISLWLLMGLDGLDGWAARRWRTASVFGALFDQESDALLMLTVCLLLFLGGRLEGWILLPGLLRYGFVLVHQWGRTRSVVLRGSRFTRSIGVAAGVGLTACLLPQLPAAFALWLAAGLSLGLALSFASSLWQLYRADGRPAG